MNKKILIKNGLFLTMDEQQASVFQGYMICVNDLITYVGTKAPEPTESFNEIVDGKHRLYMPGLVNTHGHAAMSLLRGFADDLALQVWLEKYMWPNEAKFTANDVRYGTLLSIVEMLKGGTTCFVDMYDRMDEVARAVEESGMRGCLTRGMIGFGKEDIVSAKLKEAKDFAKNWNHQANGRITTMISPHSAYTCPPDFIERIVIVSEELNIPIHTHMSETQYEVEENERQYGLRPVEHLQKLGVFSRPCMVAHSVHLNDEEIKILKHHDVRISHNPGSNLKLASGIARVKDLLTAGVLISLGTDSAASNNNLDMFEEMRLAALIHKGVSGDPTLIPAKQAIRMGTLDGAKSIWLDDVGALKSGMKADFIGINIDQPHFMPQTDFVSHVIYSASANDVQDVWVNGHRIMKGRELLSLDEEKIKHEFTQCYKKLIG